ncbi:MAG: putative DNA binding domain-containing protein [Deltaproteobacteria bacterium]|nr:putative DNA binding domain-containing protein [Deltaproteobacteria bacterium]
MNQRDLIALVDRLRGLPTETEWFDFKRNYADPQEIGEYLSALANEACLRSQPRGYLLFGVDDATHEVVGTTFDPYAIKGKGNQDLIPWISAHLQPNPGVEPWIVDHPGGRVVLLAVGPAQNRPVLFSGKAYARSGTSKVEMRRHPEKERALWTLGTDWSSEVCDRASLDDLDPEAIAKAREQFQVKHPTQAGELERWDDLTFLNKAKLLKQGAVTHTALVLLGCPEAATLLAPALAKVSWILKDADNHEMDYEHIGPPFLLAGDRLLKRIRNLKVRTLPSGTLFPQELTQYDPWVLREALHNAIAHQDYRRQARVTVVEFPDRVLVDNVGEFLPGSVMNVIEQDAPQLFYRNPFLADAMVELNLIDTQGGGIKRMFETQRRRSFPLPDYDLGVAAQVSVTIPGRILDEKYTRLLMDQSQLTLVQVILLDRVQKKQPIEHDAYLRLKEAGLVEGRFPSIMLSAEVARQTGDAGRHIRERGFDKQYYVDLILALLCEHGPVGRKEVDQLLVPKLPDRMTEEQKRRKVNNLLQELRRTGRISNKGTRAMPRWVVVESKGGHS